MDQKAKTIGLCVVPTTHSDFWGRQTWAMLSGHQTWRKANFQNALLAAV
jgi:hypothetical protein